MPRRQWDGHRAIGRVDHGGSVFGKRGREPGGRRFWRWPRLFPPVRREILPSATRCVPAEDEQELLCREVPMDQKTRQLLCTDDGLQSNVLRGRVGGPDRGRGARAKRYFFRWRTWRELL